MHRTSTKLLLIVAAFALFLVPVAAIAAGAFDDVADDSVFEADIEWLADAGVTKGCNPPTNTEFCPGANVTREQMAAFMHRLAVNKVVDAATALEADNADRLDGKDSTAFLAADGKAADADELDGFEPGELVSVHSARGNPFDNFQATSLTPILSDTINAGSGYLHITAVVSLADDSTLAGKGALSHGIFVDGNQGSLIANWYAAVECASGSCDDDTVTMTAVVPIAAGTHTVEIQAQELWFGTYIYSSSVSILFTPFGDATPLGAALLSPPQQPGN